MRRTMSIVAAFFAGLFLLGASPALAEFSCIDPVDTTEGPVSGLQDMEQAACAWKGVPYAAPPTGELRLRATQKPAVRSGVYQAHKVGPSCPQVEDLTSGGKSESFSEDCLYLNIWTPMKSGRFPVMFWIYGGSFAVGSGSYDLYDGARLAADKDLVVVTINYRLGPLGYLGLPELKEEDEHGSTGNYGLLDQVRALEWVRDNIEGFGGDPDNVTIFGQSAGGMSVCALLVSPLTEGLFHRAMDMSGPSELTWTLEKSYARGQSYVEKMGCDGPQVLECLRSKPLKKFDLKSENDLLAFGINNSPCVDGYALTGLPIDMIEKGEYHRVPTILGSTRDELRIYTVMIPGLGLWSKGSTRSFMCLLTGGNCDEVVSMYKFSDYRRPIDLAFAFGNEMVFDTPAFLMAEAMSRNNPVYLYRFDWNRTRFPHKMGAFHALDVPFFFGALNIDYSLAKMLASEKTYANAEPLARDMMTYLANFARTGDPNQEGLPTWPAYNTKTRQRIHFDFPITTAPLSDAEVKRYRYYGEKGVYGTLAGLNRENN